VLDPADSPAPRGGGALTALLTFILCTAVASCGGEPEDLRTSELREALGLGSGPAIHWIQLGGEGDREWVRPDRLEVEPGDVVAFETADWRVHTLTFRTDSLPPPAERFLVRTGQAAAPPLVSLGSRFVVTFADAPEGSYPFRAEAGGGSIDGVIVVRIPPG
jgi:plastocyanin